MRGLGRSARVGWGSNPHGLSPQQFSRLRPIVLTWITGPYMTKAPVLVNRGFVLARAFLAYLDDTDALTDSGLLRYARCAHV